jgi:hypothetical protein
VRLYDGPIYARCESEIVRINQETPHSLSLAGETSYLLRSGRFAAPYTAEPTQQLRCPRFMRTSVGLPQRREGSRLRKESREHGVLRVGLKVQQIFRCQVESTIGRPHEVTCPQT